MSLETEEEVTQRTRPCDEGGRGGKRCSHKLREARSHRRLEEARKVPPLGTSKGVWRLDGGPWPPETEEDKRLLF